ncbi:MAG: Na+/H+ antiporter NhaC family protein [Desulfitobacteriaceae bacterium]
MIGNWLSIIPALTTLTTAILTKRIIPSLSFGLVIGGILVTGNLFSGMLKSTDYIMAAFSAPENAYIILFLFLLGALTEIFKVAGGIKGFSVLTSRWVKNERGALLSVWAITPVTFLDCCFHVIATGTVSNPLIEKINGSKEKLALVINVTSSQLIVLIPVATTYVGYILGVIASGMKKAGMSGSAYTLYLKSIPYNFFSIGMLIVSLLIIFLGLGFGRWRFSRGGKLSGGVHNSHEAHEESEFEQSFPPRASNLFIPLIFLISLIIFLFWYTGHGKGRNFLESLMNAQFEKSIFIATFVSLVLTTLLYVLQKVPLSQIESSFLAGGTELLPPIVILILSWSLSSATQDLGFIEFISRTVGATVPELFIPAIVFLIGTFTSYFIGSSWATWALIMPLGLQLALSSGVNIPLIVGAVLAGGSVGDTVSPLGETPILTASVTEVSIIDHVQTTLPYALAVIGLSTILYVVAQVWLG